MMKFLVLIFLSITQFVAHSQVNKDFKKLARKKITALELENGHCTYKFDHSGRLQEMIFQEVTSWKEVYVFDSLGNWLAYNKILVYSRVSSLHCPSRAPTPKPPQDRSGSSTPPATPLGFFPAGHEPRGCTP